MQQAVTLGHIVDVGGRTTVHQARIRIHADVGLHAEVPPDALFVLVHLQSRLLKLFLIGPGVTINVGHSHGADFEH